MPALNFLSWFSHAESPWASSEERIFEIGLGDGEGLILLEILHFKLLVKFDNKNSQGWQSNLLLAQPKQSIGLNLEEGEGLIRSILVFEILWACIQGI